MRARPATTALLSAIVILSIAAEAYKLYTLVQTVSDNTPTTSKDAYFLVWILGKTPIWSLITIVTTGFVETQVFPFFIAVLVFWTGGRYCEKIWASRRYGTFIFGILVTATVLQLVLFYLLILFGFELEGSYVNGSGSAVLAVIVALKQLVSEHQIILFRGKIRLRIRWLPIVALGLVSVFSLVGLYEHGISSWLGFFLSWFYLRFYQPVPDNSGGRTRLAARTRFSGDASDAFAFAQFFPEPVSLYFEKAARPVASIARSLRIIPTFSTEEIESANHRYAARLAGNVLPFHTQARSTNERRKLMLESLS